MTNISELFDPNMRGKIPARKMAQIISNIIEDGPFDKAHTKGEKVRETKPSLWSRDRHDYGFGGAFMRRDTYLKRGYAQIGSTIESLGRVKNLQSPPGKLMRVAFNEVQDLVHDLRDNKIPMDNLSGHINARLCIAGQAFEAAVNFAVNDDAKNRSKKLPNQLPAHITQDQGQIIARRLYAHVMK